MGEKDPPAERRDTRRTRVLLRGKIIAGDAIYDCTVLDVSAAGARLRFGTPVALPGDFIFRVLDGSSYPARRVWSRGNEMGIAFTGQVIASGDIAQSRRAEEALNALRSPGLAACLDILARERYFGDDGLRRTAEAMKSVREQLESALKPHALKAARAAGRDLG
jgi:hypothetical protein